jgi:hypothetical protein
MVRAGLSAAVTGIVTRSLALPPGNGQTGSAPAR